VLFVHSVLLFEVKTTRSLQSPTGKPVLRETPPIQGGGP